MKLGSKTFLYSIVTALIVGVAIFAYMFFLMPSMYTDYKQKENLEYSKTAIQELKKEGSIRNIEYADINMVGVSIPETGNKLKISGRGFDGNIEFVGENAIKLLNKFRSMDSYSDWKNAENVEKEFKPIIEPLIEEITGSMNENIKIDIRGEEYGDRFKRRTEKFYSIEKDIMLSEFSVTDEVTGTSYTTYMGIAKDKGTTYIMMLNTMTPKATDVMFVVIKAVPMLILMMILLAFGVSSMFSRKIVNPVKKLSHDAERRMMADARVFNPITVDGKDEISDLAETLNSLYKRQAENFKRLDDESKRKEVFIKASSHQLKTPIAASMLLVDGMSSKVGKFSDRDKYLPKVKEQLNEMTKIVEEIITLNHIADNMENISVNMNMLCEEVIYINKINADSKGIVIRWNEPAETVKWHGSREMLNKILCNLVSNGINYSGTNGEVVIELEVDKLTVINRPAHIEDEIIDDIFEPFVSGVEKNEAETGKGHGLGLYVAKYFAESMKFSLRAENFTNEVRFVLEKTGKEHV